MDGADGTIDVHQHLWPARLIEQLRQRNEPPLLRGWTLHLAGEAPYEVDPLDHDVQARAELDPGRLALLSLSTPLGIEALPGDAAGPLLEAWHAGIAEIAAGAPARFAGWAAVGEHEPDLGDLGARLADPASGLVGLQVSARLLAHPAALEASAEVLAVAERLDKPVLVHPGPAQAGPMSTSTPSWWPAVVDYPGQLQAAWWAWRAMGRRLLPNLRICFAAGAGLAPAHHERFTVRGGGPFVVDPDVFVDVSSYRRQGVDALVRALGIDSVVLASDRPYADPVDPQLGEAAWRALAVTNPRRLLGNLAALAPQTFTTP